MSHIPIKRRYNRKPKNPKLDKTNPIAKKFDFYAPFGSNDRGGRDIVGNLIPTVTGTSTKAGKLGISKDFSGDSYLNYGDQHDIGATGLTVGTWFKTSQSASSAFIGKSAESGDSARWSLGISGTGDISFFIDDGANYLASTPMTWDDDQWHLAIGVVDRDIQVVRLYIDGIRVASTAYTLTTDLQSNFILLTGKYQDAAGTGVGTLNQFEGQLSDQFI